MNSKLGDGGQPQQATREERSEIKTKIVRDGWIVLDMINGNGSFKFSYIFSNFFSVSTVSYCNFPENFTPSLPAAGMSFLILNTFSYRY